MIAGAGPSVRIRPGAIEVTEERVFGPAAATLARRFARRILGFDEVRSLALDPARAMAVVSYRLAKGDPGIFLTRLADAVAKGTAAGVGATELPDWPDGEPVTLYRHAGVVSIFEQLHIADGKLAALHPALESNKTLAAQIENAMLIVPGVLQANVQKELRLRFDPRAVAALQLVRIAEAAIVA